MAAKFHKHIRLRGHDYTQGIYYVTLCTRGRSHLFGKIVGQDALAHIELSPAGSIVDACWRAIPDHFPHAILDEMQRMPAHLHAILILKPRPGNGIPGAHGSSESTLWVDGTDTTSQAERRPKGPGRGSLGAIIAAFKSETTKRVNRMNAIMGQRLWQPGYHDRATRRDTGEHGRIARYIAENPEKWR